ncbi:MAG: hypothetical protein IBX60_04000 [Candidatus Aminicenantes bacterium]|nr:hypothetical protein [Candidatus Aminicenantes bacterium]
MKKCVFENLIDDYLLNRLSEGQKEKFEEHYFNCAFCFKEMTERAELISVVKSQGTHLFKGIYSRKEAKKSSWIEDLFAFLTPKQWATAAISAVLVVIVALGIISIRNTSTHRFFINDELVRGESITLISPVIDMKSMPSQFRWKSLGKDVEYKIYLYNHELLWSTTTKNNYITLPEDIKNLMTSGEKYSWQVKAFSPNGTLIAVSSLVQFMISSEQ